jgi:NAD(P)-dependent dehydrogenase (short-subunit alcohol dehydrogenase family)
VWTDLATVDGPARLVDAAIATFGGLDILVNNVGAARPRTGGFLSVTDDDWMSTLTINFLSAVRVTRAALPHLLDRGAGSIITIASVNTVSPGPVSTDLWLGADGVAQTVAHAIGNDPHAVAKQAAGDAVTGRFTRPEEVADLVLLLASDRTANVTGADFVVDGGLINTL